MKRYDADLAQRVDAQLVGVGECRIWQGRTKRGYGCVYHAGQDVYLHRLMYAHAHGGEIPGKACILHTCDTRRCCNPDHLYVGDRRQNAQDMVDRSRYATKVTADDVRMIREYHIKGDRYFGSNAFAQRLGISPRQVRDIVSGKYWKHVT